MTCRVAVDIGGTFTDFCVFDEATGELRTLKTLSTPATPGAEVMNGVEELERRYGQTAGAISYFTHGTTVGVNTVIQRRGAELALFTTREFEDVLVVARLKVPDPYDLFSHRAPPLAPRERVYGIAERVLKDGTIETPVDGAQVADVVARAKADGADTIVVALLHSYANPANERAVRDAILATDPEMTVTLSSDVWPVIREYERTVTATVAGYVQRRVADYIGSLVSALHDAGVPAEPMITKSNGGVMAAELGKTDPIAMLLSGTASGVIGAADVAARIGARDVLSFDVRRQRRREVPDRRRDDGLDHRVRPRDRDAGQHLGQPADARLRVRLSRHLHGDHAVPPRRDRGRGEHLPRPELHAEPERFGQYHLTQVVSL